MENPVAKFREETGLDRRDFAVAAGVSYGELWNAEAGYSRKLHSQLVRLLAEHGYPGNPEEDYKKWREEIGHAIWLGRSDENDHK